MYLSPGSLVRLGDLAVGLQLKSSENYRDFSVYWGVRRLPALQLKSTEPWHTKREGRKPPQVRFSAHGGAGFDSIACPLLFTVLESHALPGGVYRFFLVRNPAEDPAFATTIFKRSAVNWMAAFSRYEVSDPISALVSLF